MKAVIFGATGAIGQSLVNILLADPYYSKVIVIVRRNIFPVQEKLIVKMTQDFFRVEEWDSYLDERSHVFCCLGTTFKKTPDKKTYRKIDYELPLIFATSCVKKNVNTFGVVSAVGANQNSIFFYSRLKGELETKLLSLKLKRLLIFRPSLILTSSRPEKRFLEGIGNKLLHSIPSSLYLGPLKNYRPLSDIEIAKAMFYFMAQEKSDQKKIIISAYDMNSYGQLPSGPTHGAR